jgi:hypothetical protein
MLSTFRFSIGSVSQRCLSFSKRNNSSKQGVTNIADYRIVDHSFDAIVVGAGKQFEI